MKKRLIQLPIMLLLILLFTASTGCSKAKDIKEESEEQIGTAEELLQGVSEEVLEVKEEIETDETVVEYDDLLNATFSIGDMAVYIAEAKTFVEDEAMNLPYQEGKGYLYIKGTIDNNGDEAKSLGQVLNLTGYDEVRKQIGNASSWIDSNGILETIEPKSQIEFDDLYMYNADNSFVTLEFEGKESEGEKVFFKVDIAAVNQESVQEGEKDSAEMINILTLMSYDIIAAIDQDKFEEVAQYSENSFIAPSLASNVLDGIYFESYNWNNCAKDKAVYIWGVDKNNNVIEMTCNDFFNTYISDFNFLANEPEIKAERIEYFPELSDYQATHYVKYTSGNNVCYLIYEETYFNQFTLTGIAVGQN